MLPTLPNLDGLIGLAHQDGVDVRPTLLRVLTDLYVQKRVHTPEEEHRYTELALWLLAAVDVPTRAAVAKKLSSHPQAPGLVIRRLARDVFEVAEPVLRHAPGLTSDDLVGLINDFGPRHAAAIEARKGSASPAPDERAKSGRDEHSLQASKPCSSGEAPADDASHGADVATERSLSRRSTPRKLGERFLDADPAERRFLLSRLKNERPAVSEPARPASSDHAVRQLERAALQRRPDEFARALEHTLRIPGRTARQIADDQFGEPVVVVATALGVPSDVLVRILLFLNPHVGGSVERVFGLVDLHEQLSLQAARHLVASWQNARPDEKATDYRPLHVDDEGPGARAFATHGRRVAAPMTDGRPGRQVANSE